eukprot:TRINITY_DN5579_c1_g6_i1.p1 TRINITY_DN5579_c1_g6~~TRINITY_DN5579_c1_g6_i1.p1  ORF type:complete len:123 (+),score=10.68 TRINITY_DN5579_c1_g6_i1:805-1173(+)
MFSQFPRILQDHLKSNFVDKTSYRNYRLRITLQVLKILFTVSLMLSQEDEWSCIKHIYMAYLLGFLYVANLMDALSPSPTTDHTLMHRSLDLEIWSLDLHLHLIFKAFILHVLDLKNAFSKD